MKFIDIHSHLIYGVDDGSKSLEQSIECLKQIKKIGLESVVCTPHIRHGNSKKISMIKKNFLELRDYAKQLGIKLYIGNEIMYSDETVNLLKEKRLIGLNSSKYVLIEFKRNETRNINDLINIFEDLIDNGYKPILAHPELYVNLSINDIKRIKESGVMLQLDATSIFERKTKKISKKLLKERLIDVVASDSHCSRKRNYIIYNKAYKKIKNKYGFEYTNIVFYLNPLSIISNK